MLLVFLGRMRYPDTFSFFLFALRRMGLGSAAFLIYRSLSCRRVFFFVER